MILTLIASALSCGGSGTLAGGTGGSAGADSGMAGSSAGGTVGSGGTSAGGIVGSGGTSAGGTVGGGGSGGTVGTAGAGGRGGDGGDGVGGSQLPACTMGDPTVAVSVELVGSDGTVVATPVTANVTVASVDSCTETTCWTHFARGTLRIALTAASQSWTLYLHNTAMPADLIKAGDTYDLSVRASTDSNFFVSTSQTVVLAHGADLVVFAADLTFAYLVRPATGGQSPPSVPDLSAFGITIADLGTGCGPSPCSTRPHGARVTVGTESAAVTERMAVEVGWLSFTNGLFEESVDTGFCDNNDYSRKAHTRMAGFRSP